jgi:sec-independent protein translocase protein TatA
LTWIFIGDRVDASRICGVFHAGLPVRPWVYALSGFIKKCAGETPGQRLEVDMFGIGMPELLIILVIILIIFGAGKLPEIGAGIGQGIRNFKKATKSQPEELAAKSKKVDDDEDQDA